MNEIRTDAIVLKRTNYREADRILMLITPYGKKSAIAKGVRKEKSRLAGAVEPFSLTELNLHEGKGELLVVTGAKVKMFYGNILKDFARLETASEVLKKVMQISEQIDVPEYFEITKECLEALNDGGSAETVLTWFYLHIFKAGGGEINLHFDTEGEVLQEKARYVWDFMDGALKKEKMGKISGNEIKMLRLMVAAKLSLVLKVKGAEEMMPELFYIAKTLNQL